jgi:hypothetical protein
MNAANVQVAELRQGVQLDHEITVINASLEGWRISHLVA